MTTVVSKELGAVHGVQHVNMNWWSSIMTIFIIANIAVHIYRACIELCDVIFVWSGDFIVATHRHIFVSRSANLNGAAVKILIYGTAAKPSDSSISFQFTGLRIVQFQKFL